MLILRNISKQYERSGNFVLSNINLEFKDKGLVSILGPSGCGKTTLLNLIGGLDTPSEGEIIVDDFPKAKKYTANQLLESNCNLDLCGFLHIEEDILEPKELIRQFKEKRDSYNLEMEKTLAKILELLDEDN